MAAFRATPLFPIIAGFALTVAGVPATASADADIKPKIVLQSSSQVGVEVAAWTPDDRYVVTALGVGRSIMIWDVRTGIIIDKAAIPTPTTLFGSDYLRLTGIEVTPDGKTLLIHGIGADMATGGGAVSREYSMDMATRQVRDMRPRRMMPTEQGLPAYEQRIGALSAIYDSDTSMTRAAAEALLPPLPRSHDGRLALRRSAKGTIIAVGAATVGVLHADAALGYGDAALAPDGQRLALIDESAEEVESGDTSVQWFDLTRARFLHSVVLAGDYGEIRWIDDTKVLVAPESDSAGRDDDDAAGPTPASLVIDATTGKTITELAPSCFVRPLPDGSFIAATLVNCRKGVGPARGLSLYNASTRQWRPFPVPDLTGRLINDLAVAPDGRSISMIVESAAGHSVLVIDRATGRTIDELAAPKPSPKIGGVVLALRYAPDGQSLLIGLNGGLHVWKPGGTEPSRPTDGRALFPKMMVSDGKMLLMAGLNDDSIARIDLATGTKMRPLDFGNVVAGGLVPGKPLFWATSFTGGIRLWNTRDWSEILTTYHFKGQGFLAVTPKGQYDTNLGPDAAQFRWIVPDQPFQSLAPQTFMRDYFEPRLTERLLDCTVADDCLQVLKQPPSIATLNRVLPHITVTGVKPGEKPGQAVVTVNVAEGIDTAAANGKTRSGVYSVRLFRDNRLALQHPEPVFRAQANGSAGGAGTGERQPERVAAAMRSDIATWRQLNQETRALGTADVDLNFVVDLPTAAGTEKAEFSAYAFNEDRVKSETSRLAWIRPPVAPATPRAFVIAIGIDEYDEPRLHLNFSAGDATLISARLAAIPGYEMHTITLAGSKGPDGKIRRVTREAIEILLSALGGGGPKVSAQYLNDLGFDASALDVARPDDIVIFSFSGHGWADPKGGFFLLPSDAKWPAGDAVPDPAALLSSDNLALYFNAIHAADIAIVIDACHSAASVATVDFKPGPMGDSGLGQLAFDKGLRILAATQASDVALEDPVLRQGLLTYALASEGLAPAGAKADLDSDGRITIDEWLRYATQRLPSLSSDVRLGKYGKIGTAGARGFTILGEPAPLPRAQEPSLFDFNAKPSPVVLRRER